MTYEVWAIPPEREEKRFIASFAQANWQYAEKLAGLLERRGYISVEVRKEKEKPE